MSQNDKYLQGLKFISSIHADRLNGVTFNREDVIKAVTSYKNMGFKHTRNEENLVVLELRNKSILHTVYIGRKGKQSFFSLVSTEQQFLFVS